MVGTLVRLIRGAARRTAEEHIGRTPFRLPASLGDLSADRRRRIDEAVILGALLQLVAHADDEYSPAEEIAIRRELLARTDLSEAESNLVIAAAREARDASVEIHAFTRDLARRPYRERVEVIGLLFQLAYADRKLIGGELEMIRKIAGLCWVEHKDFIAAKLVAAQAAGVR